MCTKETYKDEEKRLLHINSYPCIVIGYFLLTLGILLFVFVKTIKIGIIFLIPGIYSFLIAKKFTKLLRYKDLIDLLKNHNFEKLELSTSNILLFSFNVAWDGSVKAPIDVFKSQSKFAKPIAVFGMILSPVVFLISLFYSATELLLLRAISDKENFALFFSSEIFNELTRNPLIFSRREKSEILKFKWCGIPGIILIPQNCLKGG